MTHAQRDHITPPPSAANGMDKPEGPAAAAAIAAGVGTFALGLITVVYGASKTFADFLTWSKGVGPLSGATTLAVIIWLLAWVVLHLLLRNRRTETRAALAITAVLIGLGILCTFPPFFELFSAE
jgi:hypothetical protein